MTDTEIHFIQQIITGTTIFCIGACVGSFLNVVIYRLPLGKSIVYPPSHCAACGRAIPPRHNIPILSWLILRGRAACCGSTIEARYAIVEAITAVVFFTLWFMYPSVIAAVYALVFCGLVVASCIDFDLFIIPDEISLGGCLAGLALSYAIPGLHFLESITHLQSLLLSLLGLALGGFLLMAIRILGTLIFRKEAMGMGDVKLLAAIGAFLGWQSVLFTIAVSSFIGSVVGVAGIIGKSRMWGMRMPYGPYLAMAAAVWMLGGKEWSADYFRQMEDILWLMR